MAEKLSMAWVDLNFRIKPFLLRKERNILKELNGSVNFGSLNALMGPSGAGKTTLLKCINGKIQSGLEDKSKIYLSSTEKIISCFIVQHEKESLIMGLTAKKNMIYASKLKNSTNSMKIDHENNVMDLLKELMISHIVNNKVADCSGGEQKRLSIALELTSVVKPNLLCIDEPTTGLDSKAAETVVECLRVLSRKHNISIITSIHQPNNDIIRMFDKLYVLAKGGVCVYSGPPKELSSHLSECGVFCTEFAVEVLLKVASKDIDDQQLIQLATITSKQRKKILEICQNEAKLSPNGVQFKSKGFKLTDLWYLLMRTMTYNYISQWKTFWTQFLFYVLFAFSITRMFNSDIGKPNACFSFLFNPNTSCHKQLDDDSLLDQNIKFLFFTSVMVMFIQLTATTLTFLIDVKIFVKEHRNRWYSTGSYFLAKNIVEILPTLLFAATFGFLSYYLSGQIYEDHRLLRYVLVLSLGMLCTQGLGYLFGIIFMNYEQLAIMFSIGIYTSLIMFCNFYIIIKEMPQLFQILSDLALQKFVFNSVLILIYGFDRCSADQMSLISYKYDVYDDQFWTNVRNLNIYYTILICLTFILLYIKNNTFFKRIKSKSIKKVAFETSPVDEIDLDMQPKRLHEARDHVINNLSNDQIDGNANNLLQMDSDQCMNKNLSIAWIDLTLRAPKNLLSKEKIILDKISGCIQFGSLNALMGPSGSGKTSLLKCIKGTNKDQLTNETNIYLCKSEKIHTCFISQDEREHLLKGLTAKQALIYASKLKNTGHQVDHQNNVKTLLKELLISGTENTNVENCSGGEQKRIVIAMELTSHIMPNLLCIDEPTSGLDSNAAEVVIQCLKLISRKHNISVITSIHQPNNDILMMFDKLYVLAKGGLCIYSGLPQELSRHLIECDIICKEFQVPIETLLKFACNGMEDKHIIKLVDKTLQQRESIVMRCNEETVLFPDGIQFRSKRFKLVDLWILILRTMTYTYRYFWKFLLAQIAFYVTFAFSLTLFFSSNIGIPSGCISFDEDFNNTCNKTIEKLEEESLISQNVKFNFFGISIIMFLQLIATTMTFTSDVRIFLNEHRNCWYSTGCYYWAKSIVELIPTLFTIVCYIYILDIYDGSTFFLTYLFFGTIGVLCMQSIGHCIGVVFCDNVKIAIFFSVALFVTLILFCNFLIPIKELHYALQWLSNVSTVKLIFECIMISFYGFDRCADTEFSSIMYFFELEDVTYYRNARTLIYHFLFFRSLALIALLIKANPMFSSKKAQQLHELAVKSLKPSNAHIPGFNSHYEYKIKT